MRHTVRYRPTEEEEESAFVSMTDMTVSFLFIVIILMAYFAFHYSSLTVNSETVPKPVFDRVVAERDEARDRVERLERDLETARARVAELEDVVQRQTAEIAELKRRIAALQTLVRTLQARVSALTTENALLRDERDRLKNRVADLEKDVEQLKAELEMLRKKLRNPLEQYLADADATRLKILKEIEARLKLEFPDLDVKVSERNDALQFKGDGLFRSGQSQLKRDKRAVMERVADVLVDVLPCYTFGPASRWASGCNPAYAVIEAIQVEGHTDSVGGDAYNLSLSNRRAESAFWTMANHAPRLIEHLNSRGQPVMSVAGYGKFRPVASNDTREGKAENRRIDLRIIMHSPGNTAQIKDIKARLEQGQVDAAE